MSGLFLLLKISYLILHILEKLFGIGDVKKRKLKMVILLLVDLVITITKFMMDYMNLLLIQKLGT